MKKLIAGMVFILCMAIVYPQPMPSTKTIVTGMVTYNGERVDDALVTVEVPATGYLEEDYTSFNHPEKNFYFSDVEVENGDSIIVKAEYKNLKTSDYVIAADKHVYTVNLELTAKERIPPNISLDSTTSTTTTTLAAVEETTTSTISKTTSTTLTTTTEAVHDSTTTSNTASIKEEEGGELYTVAIVAAAIVLVLFIYGVISRRP
ncbi:MAG: hypothetical protein U9M95_03615 [Candidatus Altiarchaeota archaeon]|nr:hypothetical protein [Candidatus Altiarchaeota archaeon]